VPYSGVRLLECTCVYRVRVISKKRVVSVSGLLNTKLDTKIAIKIAGNRLELSLDGLEYRRAWRVDLNTIFGAWAVMISYLMSL